MEEVQLDSKIIQVAKILATKATESLVEVFNIFNGAGKAELALAERIYELTKDWDPKITGYNPDNASLVIRSENLSYCRILHLLGIKIDTLIIRNVLRGGYFRPHNPESSTYRNTINALLELCKYDWSGLKTLEFYQGYVYCLGWENTTRSFGTVYDAVALRLINQIDALEELVYVGQINIFNGALAEKLQSLRKLHIQSSEPADSGPHENRALISFLRQLPSLRELQLYSALHASYLPTCMDLLARLRCYRHICDTSMRDWDETSPARLHVLFSRLFPDADPETQERIFKHEENYQIPNVFYPFLDASHLKRVDLSKFWSKAHAFNDTERAKRTLARHVDEMKIGLLCLEQILVYPDAKRCLLKLNQPPRGTEYDIVFDNLAKCESLTKLVIKFSFLDESFRQYGNGLLMNLNKLNQGPHLRVILVRGSLATNKQVSDETLSNFAVQHRGEFDFSLEFSPKELAWP